MKTWILRMPLDRHGRAFTLIIDNEALAAELSRQLDDNPDKLWTVGEVDDLILSHRRLQ